MIWYDTIWYDVTSCDMIFTCRIISSHAERSTGSVIERCFRVFRLWKRCGHAWAGHRMVYAWSRIQPGCISGLFTKHSNSFAFMCRWLCASLLLSLGFRADSESGVLLRRFISVNSRRWLRWSRVFKSIIRPGKSSSTADILALFTLNALNIWKSDQALNPEGFVNKTVRRHVIGSIWI